MRNVILLVGTLALSALAACGSSQTSAPAAASPAVHPVAAADVEASARDVCRASFVRERECTAQWIPALVDLRVRIDVPAGIAAQDASGGRQALVDEAMQEWATDSTDDAIATGCDRILAALPPEHLETVLQPTEDCLAQSGCDAFVACQVPVLEKLMKR